MAQTVLVAEDDPDIRDLLKLYLEGEGYRVVTAGDGETALELVETESPDAAVLDVMMPRRNGLELTREIRRTRDLPILILSARSQDNDKILGLNLGADDYLAKPFNPLEMLARVRALLRRSRAAAADAIVVGDLFLNTVACTLERNGVPVALTPIEYRILSAFMRAPGRIFTKAQLYEAACGIAIESDDNTMMVHISKLRDKIETDSRKPTHIVTVRGLGYRLEKR